MIADTLLETRPAETLSSKLEAAAARHSTKGCVRFVSFYLGDSLFAIRADQVAEIVRPTGSSPLPSSPACLVGLCVHRNEVIAVVDLAMLLSSQAGRPAERQKLIVLRSSQGDTTLAFGADRLHEISSIAESDITLSSGESSTIIKGVVHTDGGDLHVLDAAGISAAVAASCK